MSYYRVCKKEIDRPGTVDFMKFDNKEDAEHHAKNQSVSDNKYIYEVEKNDKGQFFKIAAFMKGQKI